MKQAELGSIQNYCMTDIKYHTIDPLILETLNLNERRMNNILAILHGRPQNLINVSEKKHYYRSLIRDKSQPSPQLQKQDRTLPPILLNKKEQLQSPDKFKSRTSRPLAKSKSKQKVQLIQSNNEIAFSQNKKGQQLTNDKSNRSLNKKDYSKQKRSVTLDEPSFEQQVIKMQQNKKQQLMNDYMMDKLKKSKSQVINVKDIYRFEIEALVGQLTPIEELEEADKKMQRLKRRNKHLLTFDKNYYLKLNEHDMLALT